MIGKWESPLLTQAVEICDNAIDDDGDGLIDLNDEDCFCTVAEAISLIPNPSFEDQNCCPTNRSQMNCADTWIQASAPTTDYIHTCGWSGWENLPMPLPIPDGEGALGFRDGRLASVGMNGNGNNTGNNTGDNGNPNWKEYAGACLTGPLRAGVSYKFQFYIGFTNSANSPPLRVTFFGTVNCNNLPFGDNDDTFGCPTNGPNWINLGSVNASGANQWKQLEINVTPRTDIYAISIGPPCRRSSATVNPYYFFDNLVLAEQSAFEFDIRANNQPCASNLSFELPEYDSLTYQWYKDGIALIGETSARLDLPPGEGEYVTVFTSNEGCKVTRPFNYKVPKKTTNLVQSICQGYNFDFGGSVISTAGTYFDTLKSVNNCDSIISLNLTVNNNSEESVSAKLFPSESYDIGNFKFNRPGEYVQTIPSSLGCDSTVHLTLDYYSVYIPNVFSPNNDGHNDYFNINGSSDLEEIIKLQIFDRWGNVHFTHSFINRETKAGWDGRSNGQIAPEGVYLYTANLLMDDGIERTISGLVTLLR